MAMTAEGRYLLSASLGALLVIGVAGIVAGQGGRTDVLVSGAFAWLFQVGLFVLVSTILLRRHPLASFVVSMLGRMIALGVFAFLVMPALVLGPLPSLLTLAAVLAVMSVLEPLVVRPEPAVSA